MTRFLIAAAAAALAACGGCTSTAAAGPTPAARSSQTPAATPLDRKTAAEMYVRYVTPLNAASFAINKAGPKGDLVGLKKAGKRAADAEYAFVQALLKNQWPADVDHLVKQLAGQLAREVSSYRDLSKAKSLPKARAILDAWPSSDNGTAQQIRALLGLPEAPA